MSLAIGEEHESSRFTNAVHHLLMQLRAELIGHGKVALTPPSLTDYRENENELWELLQADWWIPVAIDDKLDYPFCMKMKVCRGEDNANITANMTGNELYALNILVCAEKHTDNFAAMQDLAHHMSIVRRVAKCQMVWKYFLSRVSKLQILSHGMTTIISIDDGSPLIEDIRARVLQLEFTKSPYRIDSLAEMQRLSATQPVAKYVNKIFTAPIRDI